VDGLTWHEYEQNLEIRLVDLHARVHRGAYRAQPSRRKFIPKGDGHRPLGVAALEDKIVQRAVVEVLNGDTARPAAASGWRRWYVVISRITRCPQIPRVSVHSVTT
jgi:hypothetical protein